MPKEKGITLRPLKFEDAMRALVQTPPPPNRRKTQKKLKQKC
jgi:hypothetical protein